MAPNIKNQDTRRLVKELASLTGESMTEAVAKAVRERLDRVRRQSGAGLAERLLQIGKGCFRTLPAKRCLRLEKTLVNINSNQPCCTWNLKAPSHLPAMPPCCA